ncbi:methyltransferase type 11 [candidate division KSB3 bacterium]|uniref:Methyltransferase type 11 n=1 Tax=candidate division KSB3 bacterium TaxID=2044937 RepID=A0A2G6EBN0_9BACT|nr:MAG: methyltransferase type 11 [candidate division KSB3 bacterium]PIE30825.1 MAG: methyltransferase type 11 [candidate division KSB3 bacterium]
MKLNAGCGQFRKEGYVNLDMSRFSQADVFHDLESLPYPFDDETFELIEADHVLEHLSDPFAVMAEFSRISKPGGMIKIRVPHFSRALSHPQHKRGFDVTFPFYFDPHFAGGYTGTPLTCLKNELHWFSQKYLMKTLLSPARYYTLSAIGALLDAFAGLSPHCCSRLWCFWVGGFQEIEFIFEKSADA